MIDTATNPDVRLENLPMLTAVPNLPLTIVVRPGNLPQLTALPGLPITLDVWPENLNPPLVRP